MITTINLPNKRVLDYKSLGYEVVVIGDKKTSDSHWTNFAKNEGIEYLGLDEQQATFPHLCEVLPLNTYSRKNLGYLQAIKRGAQLVWETDDDTFPRAEVGDPLKFVSQQKVLVTENKHNLWNPYSHFAATQGLWPRGYPLSKLKGKDLVFAQKLQLDSSPDIIQTLVNREPDVDAIYRLTVSDEILDFPAQRDLVSLPDKVMTPGNTQSTFWLNPRLFQYLYFPSTVSNRFADILKLYIAQTECSLAYAGFLTEQFRNAHDYLNDFAEEISMYTSLELLLETLASISQAEIVSTYEILANLGICSSQEIGILKAFLWELNEISNR